MAESTSAKKKKKKRGGEAAFVASSPRVPAWARLAFTVLAAFAVLGMPVIGLPGVDMSAVEEAARHAAVHLGGYDLRNVSIFALGVMPYISASLLVEVVAVVVPRLRKLRHGGPAGRAKLGRAAVMVTIALCAFQSYGVVTLIQSLAPTTRTAPLATPLAMLTLTAGTLVLGLVADLVTRYGLASGFAVLTVAADLGAWRSVLARPRTPAAILATVLGTAAIAAATWYVLRPTPAVAGAAKSKAPYREEGTEAAPSHVEIPSPASGLAPLFAAATILSFPITIANLLPAARPLATWLTGDVPSTVASLALIVAGAVVFGWAFYQPARIAALWRGAGAGAVADIQTDARNRLRPALLVSILYLVLLFVIERLIHRLGGPSILVVVVAPVTALALDLAAEFRARGATKDLVAIWPDQRPYAIGVAREILGAAGIAVFARAERFRRLNPFVPYAPIDLMVPAAEAARATALLEAALGPRAPEIAEGDAEEPPPRKLAARPRMTAREWGLLAAVAVLGAGTIAAHTPNAFWAPLSLSPPHRAHGALRPEAMQIVLLDDDTDLFDIKSDPTLTQSLPRGVSFFPENAPTGPVNTSLRHFARCVLGGGETSAETRARFARWAATLTVPNGDRVLLGEFVEYDEVTDRSAPAGFRTWLARGGAIIDGRDIADAVASVRGEDDLKAAVVSVELKPAAAEKFRVATSDNKGRRMAIVVDGLVVSAPKILGEISGGHLQITMGAGDPDKQLGDALRLEAQLRGEPVPPASTSPVSAGSPGGGP